MSDWSKTIELVERQDIYQMLKHGMSEEVAKQIEAFCIEYRGADHARQSEMKSAISRKGTVIFLGFVGHIATLAMQRKDREALDIGILAFDLSNIMDVDFRDAFGSISQLAFAASECGVQLADRMPEVVGKVSSRLLKMLIDPKPARVTRDERGNLVFWRSWP